VPRKGHSGKPLPTALVAQMRDEYVAEQNISKIAKKFGISQPTIDKYRREDRWDEYAERIKKRTAELSIEKLAKNNAKHVLLLDSYLSLQAKALVREQNNEKHELSILGIDKAVRCLQLLLGNPDSRVDANRKLSIYDLADELEGVDEQVLRDRIKNLRNGAGKD
jgi:transposase-like protein